MLSVSQVWGALAHAPRRDRRWYVAVEPNPGTPADDFYIRSHSDVDLSSLPGTVLASKIISYGSSSQQLNPDEGRATIGSMTISALDVTRSLTDQQRTDLLTNGNGLRGKRVSVYAGYRQIGVADYQLLETQLVDLVSYRLGGTYTIRCRDIQRQARRQVFDPIVMHLAQPLDETSTTIEMVNVPASFLPVEHGTSYQDAPSQTVAYVKIDDEIIRIPSAGIGATQFTNVTRGVLQTRAAAHTTDENAGSERGKKVTEVFYLEMPIPKLAYSVWTGVLLGQSGVLPAGYHAGIDASDFIRTSDFQNIGLDLYDQSDDTKGTVEKYVMTEGVDAKAFIERQLYRKHGLFSPVHADGQLGLKRGQPVLTGSATVGEINDKHIVDDSFTVTHDMTRVINRIRVLWNEINGKPSRSLLIDDQASQNAHGQTEILDVLAKGLVGARHTESTVRDLYEGLRDRYSGPPMIASIKCHASQLLYEVGDVVRLRSTKMRDFTNSQTTEIDRAVEIQSVKRDILRGTVTYGVFGSTQKAGPLPPLESAAALADSFYTAAGTDIATLPGVVDAGAELQLPNGLTITGHADVTNSAAIYYATKDVRIPAGNTVTTTQNVQLRIRGVFQKDGTLSSKGQGLAGVADTVDITGIPHWGDAYVNQPVPFTTQAGNPGYFGSTQGVGGLIERMRRRTGSSSRHRANIQSLPCIVTQGQVEAVPAYNLTVPQAGTSIIGLPTDLRGTSGGPGGVRYWNRENAGAGAEEEVNRGGTGGAGGGGILIISRGALFGGSGKIDLSGNDGAPGVRNASDVFPAWSGSGAGGAPGAVIFCLDGASVPSPALTSGTIIADYGDSPAVGTPSNVVPSAWIENQDTRIGPPTVSRAFVREDRASLDVSAASGREAGIAAARIFFLLPYVAPEDDTDDVVLAGSQDISLGVTEAFGNRLDPKVTLLIATITENTTTAAYSHANIYVQGTTSGAQFRAAPHFVGSAEPSLEFELPADGETYKVIARPALTNGIEAGTGEESTEVVTDGTGLSLIVPGMVPIQGVQWGEGATNIQLTKNSLSSVANDGEIDFGPGDYVLPDGTVRTITGTQTLLTPFESDVQPSDYESDDDLFYVVWGASDVSTRFGGSSWGTTEDDGVFPAIYRKSDNSWRAIDNSAARFVFTPLDTDHIFAVGYKASASGGIDALTQLVAKVNDPRATVGATLGTDLKASDGSTVLGEIDVRNDQLVDASLGFLNANPTFKIPRRRNSGPATNQGHFIPASWFVSGTTSGTPAIYEDDAVRDVCVMPAETSALLTSEAWRLEPGDEFEFVVFAKVASGTADIRVRADEYDTDALPTGKRSIGSTNGTPEDEVQGATRALTIINNEALGTSYGIFTGSYVPTATAKWFSMELSQQNDTGAGDLHIEWAGWRSKATRNTGALADKDSVDTDDIALHAVGRTAIDIDNSSSFSILSNNWVEVAAVSLTLPSSVTDAAILFDGAFLVTGERSNDGPNQDAFALAVRLLDEDDVVVDAQFGVDITQIRNSIDNSLAEVAARTRTPVARTWLATSTNMNAGVSNTFKLEVKGNASWAFTSLHINTIVLRGTLFNKSD